MVGGRGFNHFLAILVLFLVALSRHVRGQTFCLSDSTCGYQICVKPFGICYEKCASNQDCSDGRECVKASTDDSRTICTSTCSDNSECLDENNPPGTIFCSVFGTCTKCDSQDKSLVFNPDTKLCVYSCSGTKRCTESGKYCASGMCKDCPTGQVSDASGSKCQDPACKQEVEFLGKDGKCSKCTVCAAGQDTVEKCKADSDTICKQTPDSKTVAIAIGITVGGSVLSAMVIGTWAYVNRMWCFKGK